MTPTSSPLTTGLWNEDIIAFNFLLSVESDQFEQGTHPHSDNWTGSAVVWIHSFDLIATCICSFIGLVL